MATPGYWRRGSSAPRLADPRDCAQPLDGVTKAGEPCIDLPIKLGNAGLKRVDLFHMQLKQETMVAFDASTQSFAQRCRWGTHLPMRQRSQLGRIDLTIDQCLNDGPTAVAHHIRAPVSSSRVG